MFNEQKFKRLLSEYSQLVGDYFENIHLVLEHQCPGVEHIKSHEWIRINECGIKVHNLTKFVQNDTEKANWFSDAPENKKETTRL